MGRATCALGVFLGLLAGCTPESITTGQAKSGGTAQETVNFEHIIATAKSRVYPALVFIKPVQETFDEGQRERLEVLGSGVIIDPRGYVVTNHHVAEDAIEVRCVLGDREQVRAEVVGIDAETDLALLKLILPEDHEPLPVAQLGDSDAVEPGQFVMALGAPWGFTRSISLGIVSNNRRYLGFETQHKYNLWFQTDATINPGNSGGPLVNTEGRIVGINTLGTWSGSIGFAIPSNVVRDITDRLKRKAEATDPKHWPVKVDRAWLGLELQSLNDFESNTFTDSKYGVLVRSVEPGSPADDAGLQNGDVLLRVNGDDVDGRYVEELPAIERLLADLPPETETILVIARQGAKTPDDRQLLRKSAGAANGYVPLQPKDVGDRGLVWLSVKPLPRGRFEGDDLELERWNMTVKEISKFSDPQLHYLHPEGGVFIQGVRRPGNARDANLYEGEVLLEIDGQPVRTNADVKAVYDRLLGDTDLVEKKVVIKSQSGRLVSWTVLDWTADYLKED